MGSINNGRNAKIHSNLFWAKGFIVFNVMVRGKKCHAHVILRIVIKGKVFIFSLSH